MKTKKVIKFSASWCQPCKVYAKTFEKVSQMDEFSGIKFESHDVEESEEIEDMAAKLQIRGVPSTVLFDEDGNVLSRISGNVPAQVLADTIRNM
jgi:thioredoxin 1